MAASLGALLRPEALAAPLCPVDQQPAIPAKRFYLLIFNTNSYWDWRRRKQERYSMSIQHSMCILRKVFHRTQVYLGCDGIILNFFYSGKSLFGPDGSNNNRIIEYNSGAATKWPTIDNLPGNTCATTFWFSSLCWFDCKSLYWKVVKWQKVNLLMPQTKF